MTKLRYIIISLLSSITLWSICVLYETEHASLLDMIFFESQNTSDTIQLQQRLSFTYDERFNISYDRENDCLAKTYEYHYKQQWSKFTDPIILWEWLYSNNINDIHPIYSIIITAFDSLNVLEKVVLSILKLTRGKYELIIVFDDVNEMVHKKMFNLIKNEWINNDNNDCSLHDFQNNNSHAFTDRYQKEYLKQTTIIHEYCMNYKNNTYFEDKCGELQRVIFIRSWGLWETSSNNLGMCLSSKQSEYFIHVQDDMQMTQIGWNIHLTLPLTLFNNDIFSVSARCGNNKFISDKTSPSKWKKLDDKIAMKHGEITNWGYQSVIGRGRCGADIDKPLGVHQTINTFHDFGNANRGPLALNASNTRHLGYFNEWYFKLIWDCHELHARSITFLHKHSGYFPMQFRAELKWGATRRKRRDKTLAENALRKEYENWRNNRTRGLNTWKRVQQNTTVAYYKTKRIINMSMIEERDKIYHFCG